MNFFGELNELGKRFLSWLYVWLFFSFFFFFLGLQKISLLGREIFLPWPTPSTFSVLFFEKIKNYSLPPGVQLIVVSPLSAFLGQIMIALFLGFVITLPLALYKLLGFLLPAFYEKERKAALMIVLSSAPLFFLGCLFSYLFILPVTFKALYSFANPMGVIPYFDLNSFLMLSLGSSFFTGLLFLLPVIMVLLVLLKVLDAGFWLRQWQYAAVSFLIITAMITPDGSGLTMMFLSLPLTFLYFSGYAVSRLL